MSDQTDASETRPLGNEPSLHPLEATRSVSFTLMKRGLGSSVQEWNGSSWVVVDVIQRAEGALALALDSSRVQGSYVGERVVTPCVPA
jgi:hypothetical protein